MGIGATAYGTTVHGLTVGTGQRFLPGLLNWLNLAAAVPVST